MESTQDYDKFKFLSCNRPTIPSHVRKLMDSIEQFNDLHLNPIIVNPDMYVLDGQHRLKAARELGVPIYYVVDDNWSTTKLHLYNTTQRRWILADFMNYWIETGKNDYLLFKRKIEEYNFDVTTGLVYFTSQGGTSLNDFRQGKFYYNLTEELSSILPYVKKIMDYMKEKRFKPNSIYTKKPFHAALKFMLTNRLVDKEQFWEMFQNCYHMFTFCTSREKFITMFINIYNYKKRNKLRLLTEGNKLEIIS